MAPGGDRLPPHQLAGIGYPLATVAADGTAELWMLPGEPGRLDRLTCTLQLLYEMHDPARYLTPDGILDVTGVQFHEVAENRVRVTGARLCERPEQLKVSGFYVLPGAMVDAEIGFAGPHALGRAREAGEVLSLCLPELGVHDATVDIVGVDSLLGPASMPLRCEPPEVRVHVSAPCASVEHAQSVEDLVFWLTIGGPAQGGGVRVERRAHVAVIDGRIDRDLVAEEVAWVH
jgi:hypothetical protein